MTNTHFLHLVFRFAFKYVLMDAGDGGECPVGTDVAQDDCLAVSHAVGAHLDPEDWLDVDDWDYTPCGCFLYQTSKRLKVDYDLGQVGGCKSHSQAQLVCRKPVEVSDVSLTISLLLLTSYH
jgi:hypothetical protein